MFKQSHTLTASSSAIPEIMGQPALVPVKLQGREGLNDLFEYHLQLTTPERLHLPPYRAPISTATPFSTKHSQSTSRSTPTIPATPAIVREIDIFHQLCTQADLPHEDVVAASFALCTALDEAASLTVWGSASAVTSAPAVAMRQSASGLRKCW